MAASTTTVFMYQLKLQSLISYHGDYCKYTVAEFHFIYKQPLYAVIPFLCTYLQQWVLHCLHSATKPPTPPSCKKVIDILSTNVCEYSS